MINSYLLTQTVLLNKIRRCLQRTFQHKHFFDFSNYPEDSKFFDPTNKKVIGKMKEESEGKIIGTFAIQRCIP